MAMNEEHTDMNTRSRPSADSGRKRLRWLQWALLGAFSLIALRLAQVQIVNAGNYRAMAEKQYKAKLPLLAERGRIFDRNHNLLASNLRYVSFAADPQVPPDDARAIATTFSRVFGKPKRFYL
jgi:cell division protein FtsI/penicillin-binding protein 2